SRADQGRRRLRDRGRGRRRPAERGPRRVKLALNPLLGRLAAYLQEKANAQREAALRSGKPVYDFGIGDPREPTPEFIRKALRDAVPEVSQYPSIAGIPALRKAAAGYLRRRFGLSLDPDAEILPCSGAK